MFVGRLLVLLLLTALPVAAFGERPDEVLIYYANETAPDVAEAHNYDTICAWFRGTANPKLRQIADQLDDDRALFPASVDLEIGDLTRGPRRALFFTNRLARTGKCLVVRPSGPPKETPFVVP